MQELICMLSLSWKISGYFYKFIGRLFALVFPLNNEISRGLIFSYGWTHPSQNQDNISCQTFLLILRHLCEMIYKHRNVHFYKEGRLCLELTSDNLIKQLTINFCEFENSHFAAKINPRENLSHSHSNI